MRFLTDRLNAAISLTTAFAAAAFCSALSGAAMMMAPTALPIALMITSILTMMFGLPAYLSLRSRLPQTWWSAVLVGYAIGVVPIGLLSILALPDFASSGGVVTVENGVRTAAGWVQVVVFSLVVGLPGAVGGLAFWGVLKVTGELAKERKALRKRWLSLPLLSLLLMGAGIAFALPTITMDRSCHNGARDGRRSVTPEVVAKLDVGPEAWSDVQSIMRKFSDAHGWSLRESLSGDVGGYAAFHVSVCTEPGIAVTALQHYANPAAFPPSPHNGQGPTNLAMMFTVTQEHSGEAWRPSSKAFFDQLENRYGARLTFTNATGQIISRDAAEAGPYRQE